MEVECDSNVYTVDVFRSDLEHFEMEAPDFPVATELLADIIKYETMWGLFEEFNDGLQTLAKEDWISFR